MKIFSKENVKDLEESLRKLILKLVNEFKPLRIIATGSLAGEEFVRGLSDIDILMVVDYQIP
jgi:predicted nucleotidyltransferase